MLGEALRTFASLLDGPMGDGSVVIKQDAGGGKRRIVQVEEPFYLVCDVPPEHVVVSSLYGAVLFMNVNTGKCRTRMFRDQRWKMLSTSSDIHITIGVNYDNCLCVWHNVGCDYGSSLCRPREDEKPIRSFDGLALESAFPDFDVSGEFFAGFSEDECRAVVGNSAEPSRVLTVNIFGGQVYLTGVEDLTEDLVPALRRVTASLRVDAAMIGRQVQLGTRWCKVVSYNVAVLYDTAPLPPWRVQRLLWIAFMREARHECPLAVLPPELIRNVLDYARGSYP